MASRLLWSLLITSGSCLTKYSITCGPYQPTRFEKAITPLRETVSNYFHACAECGSPELFYGLEVMIATWPQYANTTHARISGYAYTRPQHASLYTNQHELLRDLVGLTGTNLTFHDKSAAMPPEFASGSVVGAGLATLAMDDALEVLDVDTGLYGHFDVFASTQRPPIKRQETQLRRTESIIVVPYCPNKASIIVHPRPATLQTLHVNPTGLTVVSDLDDILRIAEIWNFKQMFLNTFVRPFEPWSQMPAIYSSWAAAVPDAHFHYTTDAPEMTHNFFVEGVRQYYPPGTFDFRSMTFNELADVTAPRYANIKRLLQTFPGRNYVLVGDAATSSVLSSYIRLALEFPEQVQCLIIRDVSATEPSSWITPNMKALRRLKGRYMLFEDAQDLWGTATLMQRLQRDGRVVGCGGPDFEMETNAPSHGAVTSWTWTLWRMWSFYHRCFVLGWSRPHEGCPFDQRASREI